MPSASDEYVHNITFFASLAARRGTFKLEFDRATGRFTIAGNALSRTFSNRGMVGFEQSVTNNVMFRDPIVAVFKRAYDEHYNSGTRRQAYDGLVNLRRAYTGGAKRVSLDETLTAIRPYVPSNLELDLKKQLATIRPELVLTPLDLDFMKQVWVKKKQLFELLDDATGAGRTLDNSDAATNARPFASLADAIYKTYNGHMELQITDMDTWVQSLPMVDIGAGRRGLYLQKNKKKVVGSERGVIVANQGYGRDFIYYSIGNHRGGQALWRIYLNFKAEGAGPILSYLAGLDKTWAVHSFKIAGPHAFHTRKDKIVIYVSISRRDKLVTALQAQAAAFQFTDPVPGMTIQKHPGIAIGIEPNALETGFSSKTDPREARRQSYGSIRAQLIAAALTSMHAAAEDLGADYLNDEATFLKWVAIGFKAYAADLNPA